MKREAILTEGEAGIFKVTCETCPLLPHTEALGQPAKSCMSGLITNIQGPVVLNKCEFVGELESEDLLVVECKKEGGAK